MSGYIKDSLWFRIIRGVLRYIVIPIAVPVIVTIITLRYINPPVLPNVDSNVIYNSGPLDEKYKGPFALDLKIDNTAWLIISVINKGNGYAEDFEIELSLLKNNEIIDIQKEYIPPLLERKVEGCIQEEKLFYEKLKYLPSEAGVEYKFYLENFIKTLKEFRCSLLSRGKNWSKSTKITPKYTYSLRLSSSNSYADEDINEAEEADIPKSGMLIGGYDPLVMSNGLFISLQQKRLISKEDASEIKVIVESYKEDLLFGGINILKVNELIINKLLANRAITISQANEIIENSKNSGGILIGGYNVIILEVGILNALLQNDKITFEEGQRVIDQARPDGHNK